MKLSMEAFPPRLDEDGGPTLPLGKGKRPFSRARDFGRMVIGNRTRTVYQFCRRASAETPMEAPLQVKKDRHGVRRV
jgi:hypothetical protein